MLIDDNDYEYEYEFVNNDFDFDYLENSYNNFNTYTGQNYVYNFRPSSDLTNKEIGFLRGNMFNSVYDNYYKKIKKISTTNERERLLLQIQELSFVSIDLSLYLDVYPNDTEVLKVFKNTNKELSNLVEKYESIYGPLKSVCDKNGNSYEWSKSPWPFTKGGEF